MLSGLSYDMGVETVGGYSVTCVEAGFIPIV